MFMSIYKTDILEYYKNPANKGKINNADYIISETNTSCGDQITIYLNFDPQDNISDIKFDGHGCAISIASTSMLTEYLQGKHKSELKLLTIDIIEELLGIKISSGRLNCATIALKALKKLEK